METIEIKSCIERNGKLFFFIEEQGERIYIHPMAINTKVIVLKHKNYLRIATHTIHTIMSIALEKKIFSKNPEDDFGIDAERYSDAIEFSGCRGIQICLGAFA